MRGKCSRLELHKSAFEDLCSIAELCDSWRSRGLNSSALLESARLETPSVANLVKTGLEVNFVRFE